MILSTCQNYIEDPCVCDDIGDPKGQCLLCGCKWWEHDVNFLPEEEKESARRIQAEKWAKYLNNS